MPGYNDGVLATGAVATVTAGAIPEISGAAGIATWPTAAAYANGVSLAEVLGYVQDSVRGPAGAYIPGHGYKVTKAHNLTSDNADLFTVTGKVMVTLITGEVTTVVGGAATYKLRVKTDNVDLCAASTIDTDAVGTMYMLTGDFGDTFHGNTAPVLKAATANSLYGPFVLGLAGGTLTIESDMDAADTGVIAWTLYYLPLEASAAVVAA